MGLIPLVELTKMQGNSTCPPLLWISRWKNGLPTLRPPETISKIRQRLKNRQYPKLLIYLPATF